MFIKLPRMLRFVRIEESLLAQQEKALREGALDKALRIIHRFNRVHFAANREALQNIQLYC